MGFFVVDICVVAVRNKHSQSRTCLMASHSSGRSSRSRRLRLRLTKSSSSSWYSAACSVDNIVLNIVVPLTLLLTEHLMWRWPTCPNIQNERQYLADENSALIWQLLRCHILSLFHGICSDVFFDRFTHENKPGLFPLRAWTYSTDNFSELNKRTVSKWMKHIYKNLGADLVNASKNRSARVFI